MTKRIISMVLALCLTITGIVFTCTVTAAEQDTASTAADYGLAKNVEDGNILHCFNWTLSQIRSELQNIAQAGFTSIQTSPLQPHDGQHNWYWLYQPSDSTVGNELGSYNDLKNLCSEASKYGIKIIVDVVANHLAGSNDGNWSGAIAGSWRNGEYFHNEGACNNWDNRYDVTHKNIGMPDLNSEHSEVQNRFAQLAQSLKSAGVAGIRWDAAKHIGLPSEGCDFWKKIAAVGMYNYGEILDNPAGSSGDDYNNGLMKEYASMIGVTDASFSGHITGCIRDRKTDPKSGNWLNRGVPANRIVYWAESHDTFCNNGWTNSLGEDIIDRAYAVHAARADSQSLYFSRPFDHNHDSISVCQKGSTHYTSKQVAAVNHFHNAMVGTGENFAVDNGCFVICRGGGAVIVSPNGGDFDITVANGGGMVPAGSYTDEVSGSKWTVSGGSISGHIGSSGIAVIYGKPQVGPSAFANPGDSTYKTDTISVTLGFTDATSASYSIDGGSFKSYTNGQTITIGSGLNSGTKTTLTVRATNGTATDQATYTYVKIDPNAPQTVYFDNSTYNWSQIYCYLYYDHNGSIVSNGDWPGVQMTKGTGNTYYYDVPKGLADGRVIFTENSGNGENRYPGEGDPGLDLNSSSMIFGENRAWTVYTGVPMSSPTQNPGDTTPGTSPTEKPAVTPTEKPTAKPTEKPTEPSAQQPTVTPITPGNGELIGDADHDGRVSILDATSIQRHRASIQRVEDKYLNAADADRDGQVSILDATMIQRYLVGLVDSSCKVNTLLSAKDTAESPTQAPTKAPVKPTEAPTQAPTQPEQPVETPTNPPQTPTEPDSSPVVPDGAVILNASATSEAPEAWYAWTWGSDAEGRWIKGDGDASAVVFVGLSENVIFVRAKDDMEIDWNNGSVYNQTDDLSTQPGGTFTTSGWNASRIAGSWQ